MFRIDRSSVEYDMSSHVVIVPKLGVSAGAEDNTGSPLSAPASAELFSHQADEIKRMAQVEADAIVGLAREQAAKIRAEAGAAADEIRSNAYNKAVEAGKAEALRRAEAEILIMRKDLKDLTQRLNKALNDSLAETVDEWEGELLDLSIDIARKIIGVELDKNDEAFKSLVQNAISHMRGDAKITVRVSEREYESYFSGSDAYFQVGGERVKAPVIADPQLKEGDCVIESEGEMINAGVEQQLGALKDAMERGEA